MYFNTHTHHPIRYKKIANIVTSTAAFGLEFYQKGVSENDSNVDMTYYAAEHKKITRAAFAAANPNVRQRPPYVPAPGAGSRKKVNPEATGLLSWLPTLALLFINLTFSTLLRGDSFAMLTQGMIGYVTARAFGRNGAEIECLRFISRRSKTNSTAKVVLTYAARAFAVSLYSAVCGVLLL